MAALPGVFEVLAAAGIGEIDFAGYGQGANGPIIVAHIRSLLDAYELRASAPASGTRSS